MSFTPLTNDAIAGRANYRARRGPLYPIVPQFRIDDGELSERLYDYGDADLGHDGVPHVMLPRGPQDIGPSDSGHRGFFQLDTATSLKQVAPDFVKKRATMFDVLQHINDRKHHATSRLPNNGVTILECAVDEVYDPRGTTFPRAIRFRKE